MALRWLSSGRWNGSLLDRRRQTKIQFISQDDIGWCRSCGTVTEVETFDPNESVDDYRKHARRLQKKRRKYPNDEQLLEVIAHAEAMVTWRELRKSPPKCLRCGSTQIDVWKLRHELSCSPGHAPHPGCGGALRKISEWDGPLSFFDWEWDREILYTVDGERITTISSAVLGASSALLANVRGGLSRLWHGALQKPSRVHRAQVPDFPAQLLSEQAVGSGTADVGQFNELAAPSFTPTEPPPLPPEETPVNPAGVGVAVFDLGCQVLYQSGSFLLGHPVCTMP